MTIDGVELQLRRRTILLQKDCAHYPVPSIAPHCTNEIPLLLARYVLLKEDGWALAAATPAHHHQFFELSKLLGGCPAKRKELAQDGPLFIRRRPNRDFNEVREWVFVLGHAVGYGQVFVLPNVRHERRDKGREAALGTSARWRG